MGLFIKIKIDTDRVRQEVARAIVLNCPVNIFAFTDDGLLKIDYDQEDECTCCDLCLKLAPPGALIIQKLYMGEKPVSHSP